MCVCLCGCHLLRLNRKITHGPRRFRLTLIRSPQYIIQIAIRFLVHAIFKIMCKISLHLRHTIHIYLLATFAGAIGCRAGSALGFPLSLLFTGRRLPPCTDHRRLLGLRFDLCQHRRLLLSDAPSVLQPSMQDELVATIEAGVAQLTPLRWWPAAVTPAVVQDQRRLAVVVAVVHVLQPLLVLADPAAQFARDKPDHVLVPDVADLLSIIISDHRGQ